MIDPLDYTMENLLNMLLSRIPDTLDKREGSVIYDALAPAAHELASLYESMANQFEQCFIETATGNALDMRCGELGVTRRAAVKAIRLGYFYDESNAPYEVTVGMRFATIDGSNSINFQVMEQVESGVYHLEAETAGASANAYEGELMALQYTEGLAKAEIKGEPVIDGSDAEDDDTLRARYFYHITDEPANGNCAQYLQWALEYPGIGKAKVFPRWNGVNTVKVSILASDDEPASVDLVSKFQAYLDPNSGGMGQGVAPIGAQVTVTTATEKTINVSFTAQLNSDLLETNANSLVTVAISEYFKDSAYRKSKVYYMEVGAAILSVEVIESVSDLKINNGSIDIDLTSEEIPVLGQISMEVAS